LLVTKRVHQERHCRCTNRIWLQKESRILPTIVSSYTTVWLNTARIQRNAQDQVNCKYLVINKNQDALRHSLEKLFVHNRTNVCGPARIHCWKEVCRKRSCDVEKGERSLLLYFCKCHGIYLQNLISLAILGWLQIMDCNQEDGKTGWSYTARQDIIYLIILYIHWLLVPKTMRLSLRDMLRDIKNGWRTCLKARRERWHNYRDTEC